MGGGSDLRQLHNVGAVGADDPLEEGVAVLVGLVHGGLELREVLGVGHLLDGGHHLEQVLDQGEILRR